MRLFIVLTMLSVLLPVRFTLAASDLRIVALTGTPAIGADEPFVAFDQRAINDRGDVAFIGLVNDEQLTGKAEVDFSVILGAGMGVWIEEFGQQQRNVLTTNAEETATPRIRTVQAIDMNSEGQLAIRVLHDDGLAVRSDHDGTIALVAANGDRLPDLDSGLYWPRGNVDPDGPSPAPVARLGELMPDDSSGATFRDFQEIVLNSAADLAFWGRLNDPSGEDAFGIFLKSDDNLRMIGHTSRPLPGVEGSVIVTEPAFWLHGSLAMSDNSVTCLSSSV